MDNNDLKNLIAKIANNEDKKAFSDLFNYFAPRIIGYLIGSGSNMENSEEITQEVLSSVWLKASQFDSKKGNVNTWVYTIARNKRIDKYRKNTSPDYNTKDIISALYPEEGMQSEDMGSRIKEMQSKLDKKERKLIKMNFFEGKTHKKMSYELEIPLGTVKSRIRTILTKMKKST